MLFLQEKMQLDFANPDELDKLTYAYAEGLQWVLHYYYDGVASWSWFYPYHYSPMISGKLLFHPGVELNETGYSEFFPINRLLSHCSQT
jgi:5'-3' exoribonuclease 1